MISMSSNIRNIIGIICASIYVLCFSKIAVSKEMWPEQPEPALFTYAPSNAKGFPPFRIGSEFMIGGSGLFFKHRKDLDCYRNNCSNLQYLLESGAVKKLLLGRTLTALEKITSYAGRARDHEYGDGYVVLFTRY